ncbi:MAG: hypothetical protein OXN81_11250 [Alphaproteobacteria bacterium]|nr:hypothetical protein [Alphaproteobacteria bacterium]
MTIREIDVHITGPERHRWRRLRLDLPEEATREDMLKAVAEEFARRDADFYARQGRLPL